MTNEEKIILQAFWVEHASGFFVSCIGGTIKQQRIASTFALAHFFQGNSGARSVFFGFDQVRRLINEKNRV
jgi:hypothetical protein